MRMRMLIAAMAALVMSAAGAASFNGVTYSESTTVPIGKWTCQFSKAKTYAYNHNIPLLVVWVNPGCGFCESFERNVMANSSVLSWMKSRGYVCVIAINGKTPGADLASDFIGAISQFPQCTVYWKPKSKTAIKYSFTGRRMTAAEYMALIDGKVGARVTAIGNLPKFEDIDLANNTGKFKVIPADLKEILKVDVAGWKKEIATVGASYDEYDAKASKDTATKSTTAKRVPKALRQVLADVTAALKK